MSSILLNPCVMQMNDHNTRVVFFDVGGVLLHYDRDLVCGAIADTFGLPLEHLSEWFFSWLGTLRTGGALRDHLSAFNRFSGLLIDDPACLYTPLTAGLRRNELTIAFIKFLLDRSVQLGVISNTNAFHEKWMQENVPELQRVKTRVYSFNTGIAKPDPAIFQFALNEAGCGPSDALFVDDEVEFAATAACLGIVSVVYRGERSLAAIRKFLNI